MSKPPLLSIRRTIPFLIVTPLILTVLFAGILSYVNSRKSVEQLAEKIGTKASLGIREHLQTQLATPQAQIQSHAAQFSELEGSFDFKRLQRYFWQLFKQNTINADDAYTFLATPQGEFLGLRAEKQDFELRLLKTETAPFREDYLLDAKGKPTQLRGKTEYYPRQRAWYKAAENLSPHQSAWSPVYIYTTGDLGITAVQPIYSSGEFLGVFGIDMRLAAIQQFLQKLEISDGAGIFVIERNGTLIATSTEDQLSETIRGKSSPIDILDFQNPRLQPIAMKLFEFYGEDWQNVEAEEHFRKRVNGKTEFLTISPLTDEYGIDWLVIVAIPESDFRSIILANTQSTAIVGTIIALIGSAIGLMVARWVIRPIDNLNNAAKAIEDQSFQPMTLDQTSKRPDELGQLATVFQGMGTVISANQASLEEQKEVLEAQVAQAKRQQQSNRKYTLNGVQSLLQRSRDLRRHNANAALVTPTRLNRTPESSVDVTVEDLLYQVSYFSHLDPQDIQHLLTVGQVVEFSAQDVIFAEDEPGNSFYIILSGAVDITVEQLNKFLTHIEAGGFFGELSLLLGLPRTATVRTTEPTTVFCLDHSNLRQLIDQDPAFADRIATEISAHQEELASRQALLLEQGIISSPDQISRNPLAWIRQRIQKLFGGETSTNV